MTRENLVTNGFEFVTPDGVAYSGPYHVHHSKGAMVGATHSDATHDSLFPFNNGAEDKLEIIQKSLRDEMRLNADHKAMFKRNFSTPFSQQGSAPTGSPTPVTRQRDQGRQMQPPPRRQSTGTSYSSGY